MWKELIELREDPRLFGIVLVAPLLQLLMLGYATNLVAAYALQLAGAHARAAAAPPAGGIEPRIRVWFNPRLESRDFMIPGVLALLLLVVTTNLSSMGIVREKELGTLEQLNVTPLRRWELIVSKLLPYGLVGLLDVLLVLHVAIGCVQ